MSALRIPSTAALRALRAAKIPHEVHLYAYVEHGGAARAAAALGLDEHQIIKTIVFEDESQQPLLVLMHGDREVSTRQLARALSSKRISPCLPQVARRHTGYRVGGTSPIATRKPMPVYMEATVDALESFCINGGSRGVLVELAPAALRQLLQPILVSVAV